MPAVLYDGKAFTYGGKLYVGDVCPPCCECCGGWALNGTVTIGGRKGPNPTGCYPTWEETEASGECYRALSDAVLELVPGSHCNLYSEWAGNIVLDEPREVTGSDPFVCSGSQVNWLRPTCGDYEVSSQLFSDSIYVNYREHHITLEVQELSDSGMEDTVFTLRYTPGSSLCRTSVSLTLGDFTVINAVKNVATAPDALRAETAAITFDLTVTP